MSCKPIVATGRSVAKETQRLVATANVAAGNAAGSQLIYTELLQSKNCTSHMVVAELYVDAATEWVPTDIRVLLLQNNDIAIAANDTVDMRILGKDYEAVIEFASSDFKSLDGVNFIYSAYATLPEHLTIVGDGASSNIKALIIDMGGTNYSTNKMIFDLILVAKHD